MSFLAVTFSWQSASCAVVDVRMGLLSSVDPSSTMREPRRGWCYPIANCGIREQTIIYAYTVLVMSGKHLAGRRSFDEYPLGYD